MIGRDYEARIKTKTAQLHAIWVSIHSGYEESKVGLTHTQEAEVQAAPLQSELRHSLENKDLTDYEVADFILRKLATLEALPRRKTLQLVDVVLENVDTILWQRALVGSLYHSERCRPPPSIGWRGRC